MHNLLGVLLLLLTTIGQHLLFADCVPSGTGLLGWWPGDGNANNVYGTNNGTLQGGATASGVGLVGNAFSFDGTNNFVSIPNSAFLRPTNLTIEAWVNFASMDSAGSGGSPAGDQYIVFRQNTRSADFEGFDLSKTRVGTTNLFRFLISSASGQPLELHSSTVISTGVWYHVAGVRGSNFMQLYVNGALERQTNITFAQDYGNFPLYFGSSGQAAWDHKLKGSLDEVSFYNRALSSNEIAAIYSGGAAGKCKAPAMTVQPEGILAFTGSNVTFTVSATGFSPLSFQWRSNSIALAGATTASLTLPNVQPVFSADYSVIITNVFGSATSAVATLTVVPPPSVIVSMDFGDGGFGPKTGPAALGQDANDYWNNFPSAGTVPNLQTARGNTTQAAVTVPYGENNWLLPSAASGDPMVDDYLWWNGGISPVTVNQLPTGTYDFYIYSHDGNFQLSVGGANYGIKNAFESFPLSHPPQWQEGRQYVAFRNVAVTNGGAPVSISVSHGLQPDAIISGLQIVCNSPWILQQPTNVVVAATSNLVLHVNAEASPAASYQWFFNGNPLGNGGRVTGAMSNTLTISDAQLADGGNYFAVVANRGGASTSSVALVQIGFAPTFSQAPANQTNLTGTSAQFTANVTGDQPLALQWWFNGNPLSDDSRHSGSTTMNLTVSGIAETDAGNYWLVASNAYGVSTSAVASLTVRVPATILIQPSDQYVLTNANAAFTVSAKGDPPLAFTWFFGATQLSDGGRISGSQTAMLSIQNVQSGDLGGYYVVVSNVWGAVTSTVATLNFATIRYVNMANGSPAAPYLTWATAANVIQDAISVAGPGDHIVVTNGTYASGGSAVNGSTLVNRVAVNQPLVIESVNGPSATIIQGVASPTASAIRGVYLTNGAVLNGFTVRSSGTHNTNNFFLEDIGGGIFCESLDALITNCVISACRANGEGGGVYRGTLYNCTISGNSAGTDGEGGGTAFSTLYNCSVSGNSAIWGGGSYYGALSNCVLSGNSAQDPTGKDSGEGGGALSCNLTNCVIINNVSRVYGGGASAGVAVGCVIAHNSADNGGGAASLLAINCTIVGNSAVFRGGTGNGYGGGIADCTVINSILVNNSTGFTGPNYFGGSFSHTCSSPAPGGDGNFDADPLFLDYASGNYRLQAGSPCINAGTNDSVSTTSDLDGQQRIVDGIVDIGAYEYQHAPFILTQPASQSVYISSNLVFSVSALGDSPLSYSWQKNGTNLPVDGRITGTDTVTLSISNMLLADVGDYTVIVSNASGSITSSVATLTALGLPVITSQPLSRTVPAGTNVTFSVSVNSVVTPYYQWRMNGAPLAGQTAASLSLTNVQSANAGPYDVVVTNYYGGVTSSVATLTVVPAAPTITTQAVSRVASVGSTVSFTVAAKGSEPMTCQWQFNGTHLPGANGFNLTLQNVNSSRTGTYRAAVSNSVGFAFSTNVTLAVTPIIIWGLTNNSQLLATTAVPADATNIVAIVAGGGTDGGLPCLALRADGSLVAWGFSPRALPPPTNAVDLVAMSVGSSGGLPNTWALRADGSLLGWNGTSKPPLPPPGSNTNFVAVAAGGSHTLALRDDGTVIAWGSNSSGQTNVPANATNIVAIAAGTSHSLALRSDGTVLGWGLNTSGQATAFTNTAGVVAIAADGNQSIGLTSDGTVVGRVVTNDFPTAILYGRPPASATNMLAVAAGSFHSLGLRADRTVTGWGQTNFGQLNMPAFATNVLALAAGGNDSLALVPDPFAPPIPPRIGRPPLSRVLTAGQASVMNALAIGGLPLHYQWYRNGAPLEGRTNQWLSFTNCQLSDAGQYQFAAFNDFGSATSAVATVTVAIPRPLLKSPTKNASVVSFTVDTLAGALYISESSDGLSPQTWTEFDRRLGSGAPEVITDTNAISGTRLYRVQAFYPPPP